MGIGVVLFLWSVVGVILATVGTIVLRSTASFLTRKVNSQDRRKLILAAGLLPWLCLGWGSAVFLVQAEVNERVFHRDPGIGDAWKCPLPNGYALLMIDVPDQGYVYNPKTQPGGFIAEQEDAIAGVRVLQLAGRYIVGGIDSQAFGRDEGRVDSYFLLDTNTGRHTLYSQLEGLRSASLPLGIQLDLESIGRVYRRYRYTWFDAVVIALLFSPPPLGMALLGLWIVKLRSRALSEAAV